MSKPIKLPSGQWRIRFADVDGLRQSRTFATYDLARAELRRLEQKTDDDRVRRERFGSSEMTVAEAYEKFVATRKPDPRNTKRRADERADAHERHYEMHIAPHLSERRLVDLTPDVIGEWTDRLVETKTARPGERNASGKTLSASTIRNVVSTLRQIYSSATRRKLDVVLADSLRQARRRSKPRALQCVEDVRALLRVCEHDPWFRVALALSCYCGMRLGEVASLRWRHVGADTITIATSWDGPLKARYEDDEDGPRVVPIDPELRAILDAWRATTSLRGADDHVIVKLTRGKLGPLREHKVDVAQKTRSACKRAELLPMTFKDAGRASYATIVGNAGLPVGKLQALLGHKHATTTAIYVRPESAEASKDPRARLSGLDSDDAN